MSSRILTPVAVRAMRRDRAQGTATDAELAELEEYERRLYGRAEPVKCKREPNVGNGHILIASCECGWTATVGSFEHDARQKLSRLYRAHKVLR